MSLTLPAAAAGLEQKRARLLRCLIWQHKPRSHTPMMGRLSTLGCVSVPCGSGTLPACVCVRVCERVAHKRGVHPCRSLCDGCWSSQGQGAHRSNGSSNQHTHNHKAGGHGTKVWSCCLSPTQAAALSLRGGGNRKGGRNRQGGTLRGNALAHTLSARSGLRRTPSHRAATPTRSLRRPQSATLTRAYAYNSPGAFLGYTADSTRRTGKRRSQRPVLPL